jgi:hypothetical protein
MLEGKGQSGGGVGGVLISGRKAFDRKVRKRIREGREEEQNRFAVRDGKK